MWDEKMRGELVMNESSGEVCYHASFYNLLLSFFTSFSSLLPNFLTLILHFTPSHPTTRQ